MHVANINFPGVLFARILSLNSHNTPFQSKSQKQHQRMQLLYMNFKDGGRLSPAI